MTERIEPRITRIISLFLNPCYPRNPRFLVYALATALWNRHLYLTEQPYGLVCGVVTGLPANDSSNATFT